MTAARRVVTSIVQARAGATTQTPAIRTTELVPMREEVYRPDMLASPEQVAGALHKVQRHVAEATQAARSLPVQGGTYWPSVTFAANTAHAFLHGVAGGLDVAWLLGSVRPAVANAAAVATVSVIEVGQDSARGRISLAANVALTADVWFYARPSASEP